jgi:ATP-dependent RNA helicase DDX42
LPFLVLNHTFITCAHMSKRGFGFAGFSLGQGTKKPKVGGFNFGKSEDSDDDGDDAPQEQQQSKAENAEDEVDPLDAFMADVHATVAKEQANPTPKAIREDLEEDDPVESFLKHRQGKANAKPATASGDVDSDEEVYSAAKAAEGVEYDSDDNPIVKKWKIEPLPPVDHSKIEYPEFEKCFYEECEEIQSMTDGEVAALRKELETHISGSDTIRPVKTWEHLGFDDVLMKEIKKQGYTEPTGIQKQALPVALSGRDIIGIAKTGSGKTAAFVLPMMVHIMDQPELQKGDGPIAVVCAPTRELAHQIYLEARKFAKGYGIRVGAVYGGASKMEQLKELRMGCEVVVATPGRLIDMIKNKTTNMRRVTYLVLDEADRMFDMGFEPQVRSIVNQTRPDRQTLLFSATFKRSVERLAREILDDPIRITTGNVGQANADVTQIVEVLNESEKWPWLIPRLPQFVQEGSVLIFVSTKLAAEELSNNLKQYDFHAASLHGDKDQNERTLVMHAFKSENLPILVATDVAARGLDIKTVRNVVNYDVARDIDSHIHRIGRTGRAGVPGVAYTLITQEQANFAAELVRNLEAVNQIVPPALVELAMKNPRFRSQRQGRAVAGRGRDARGSSGGRTGRGRGRGRSNIGGAGIGYSEENDDDSSSSHQSPGGLGSMSNFDNRGAAGATRPSSNAGGYSGGGVFGEGRQAVSTNLRSNMMTSFRSSFVKSSGDSDTGGLLSSYQAKVIPPLRPQPLPPQPPPQQQQQYRYQQQQPHQYQQYQQPQQQQQYYPHQQQQNANYYSSQNAPSNSYQQQSSSSHNSGGQWDRDRDRDSRGRDRDGDRNRDRHYHDSRDRDRNKDRDRDSRGSGRQSSWDR